jgi:TIR domain
LTVVEDDKLLVFISWSKDLAREVAAALKEFLEIVFDPVVLPWMSHRDIELGSRSMAELGKTLDRSSFGIIVVTRANQNSQWINFEAGALSKKVGDPIVSVIPLLVDFDRPTDLTGPMAQFQAIVYGREELRRMMKEMAERVGVSSRTVEHRFESHWTAFDDQVQLALKNHPADASVSGPDKEDKTDEILAILRQWQSDQRATDVMVAASEGALPIGPVYFTKDYVKRDLASDKRYPQGTRGVVLREHKRLGRVTHVDLRLPDGEFLLKVPIDYIRTI